MLTYVLSSLAWSVFGLMLGFALGVTAREVHQIKEAVVDEPTPTRRRRRSTWPDTRALGIAVLLLALGTVCLSAISAQHDRAQSRCQANYNAKFVQAFRARTDVATQDRNAINKLLFTFGSLKPTPQSREVGKRALDEYIATVQKNDQQRALHPLPEPPDPNNLCN